jgi:hypothetical protein
LPKRGDGAKNVRLRRVNLRMEIGGFAGEEPSARLQFTTSRSVRNLDTGAVRTFKAPGLEIGAAKTGTPAFYLNGQSKAELEQRLGLFGRMNPTAETILAVAVAVVGFGIYLVATLD